MRAVICKGDRTSHGGRVLEGNPNVTTGGRQVAQLGHATICPRCKGKFPIVEGVPTHTYGGKPTAVEGMHTACGATLIASQREMVIDTADGGQSSTASAVTINEQSDNGYSLETSLSQFGRHFDDSGKFVSGYGLKDPRNPANPAAANNERVFSMAQSCSTVSACIAVADQHNAEASRLYSVAADLRAKGFAGQADEVAAMARDADYASRVASTRAKGSFNTTHQTWSDGVAGRTAAYGMYRYSNLEPGQYRAAIGLSGGIFNPAVVNIPAAAITPWSTTTVQNDSGTRVYQAAVEHELSRDLNVFSAATGGLASFYRGGAAMIELAVTSEASALPRALTAAEQAAAWQGSGLYPGVDRYRNITLKPGTYIVGAAPGQGNYYTTLSGMERSGLDVIRYYERVQVAPNLTNPAYDVVRGGLQVYRVTEQTEAAFARTLANPQFGEGGLPQIFLPNYATLEKVEFLPFVNKIPGVKP